MSAGMETDESLCNIPINLSNFPAKLWRLVNNPQMLSIGWDSTGEGVLIDMKLFDTELLSPTNKHLGIIPDFFKTKNFTSFVRQLNLYGFKKVSEKKQMESGSARERVYHYCNPNFKRGQPELLANILRLTSTNKAKIESGKEVHSRPPSRLQRLLLSLPIESREVMGNGHQHHWFKQKNTTPYLQQMNKLDQTPTRRMLSTPKRMETAGASSNTQANKEIQGSFLYHLSPEPYHLGPYGSRSMHMEPSFQSMVAPENYGTFIHCPSPYTYMPVYHCCPPASPDRNYSHFHQPAVSYPHYGYYPSFQVNYFHPSSQYPAGQPHNVEDPSKNDLNLETVFKIADELQGSPVLCRVKVATPEKHRYTSSTGSSVPRVTGSSIYSSPVCTTRSPITSAYALHGGLSMEVLRNVPLDVATTMGMPCSQDSGMNRGFKQEQGEEGAMESPHKDAGIGADPSRKEVHEWESQILPSLQKTMYL